MKTDLSAQVEEFCALREKAAEADDEVLMEFEQWEFTNGAEVTGGYHPLIAKFIAHAANNAVPLLRAQQEEIRRLLERLTELHHHDEYCGCAGDKLCETARALKGAE